MARTVLAVPAEPSWRESDFIGTACNRVARVALAAVESWPQGRLILTGPAKSGKTHLARIWTAHQGAVLYRARDPGWRASGAGPVVIEDVHAIAGDGRLEIRLFDCVNRLAASGRLLLLTGSGPPGAWGLALPDLASRMVGSRMVEILPPDEELVPGLILKQFSDRQVTMTPAMLRYLANRCPRSYEAVHAAVMALDTQSLAARQRITRTQIETYFANSTDHGQ